MGGILHLDLHRFAIALAFSFSDSGFDLTVAPQNSSLAVLPNLYFKNQIFILTIIYILTRPKSLWKIFGLVRSGLVVNYY